MNDEKSADTKMFDAKFSDVGTAMSLLTRLPLAASWLDATRMGHSIWAFPIVGLIVGLISGLTLAAMTYLGISNEIAAALALIVLVLLTGAMHEDGLADCCDGLGGGQDKSRALEIMKDSAIGAYGAIGLILAFSLRWSALSELAPVMPIAALVSASMLSRSALSFFMYLMPNARPDGLSKLVGRPTGSQTVMALLIPLVIVVVLVGWSALTLIPLAFVASLPLAYMATRKLGGQTGDVLGGIQQCVEIATLILLASFWI